MRTLLLIAGLALVIVLGFVIDAQSRVEVVRAERPTATARLCAVGRIEGATPEVELRPQLSGRVKKVLVVEGQFVEEGDTLLQLDDEEYRFEVAQAQADLDQAEAQLANLKTGNRQEVRDEAAALYRAKQAALEQAELAWRRIAELREANAVAQQKADDQRTAVAALRAEVEAAKARVDLLAAPPRPNEVRMDQARIDAARARLELAKVQLGRTQLRAPARGQILKVDIADGEMAAPTSVQPLVIMADTSKYRVRAYLEEMDAPLVRAGLAVTVRADGLPGHDFKGRVSSYSPRMDRKELWSDQPSERYDTKTREVWVDLEDVKDLVVGLRVDAEIHTDGAPQQKPELAQAAR